MAETPSGETIAEQLGEYITNMTIEDLPLAIVEKTKQIILDTLGCMLAGSQDHTAEMVSQYVRRHGTNGNCTIFGNDWSASPEQAGLANGTAAHVLEMDDGHRPSDNHLASVVVPSALAMAEASGASGTELIMAVTLAYDVMGRIGESVLLPRQRQPFHHTGTTGVFGSAAAAGRLLGMNARQVADTFGVAGDGASSLSAYRNDSEQQGIDVKPFHAGRAAQIGIASAHLVLEGFDGPRNIFEDQNGFCRAFAGEPRPELICKELGHRFAVAESGFKIHASTGGLFTSIDAALWLRREHALNFDTIERIRIGQPRWHLDRRRQQKYPSSSGASRPNGAYVVAAALVDGELSPRQHTAEKLADPRIKILMDRIEFVTDPDIEKIFEATKNDPQFFVPCVVEVTTKGQSFRRLERTPLGYDPERGLSREQVVSKFHSQVTGVISPKIAIRIVDWTFGLDQGSDTKELAQILS